MSDTINDFFDSLEKENLSGREMREKIDEFIKQNNMKIWQMKKIYIII